MHKWNVQVLTEDGMSFRAKAKIISERQLAVRGDWMLPPKTPCRVDILLPENRGSHVYRQVEVACTVAEVVVCAQGIRLEMNVTYALAEDMPILREHGRTTKK